MKVLIVDDDSQIQKAYATICENQGWQVVIARDGVEALDRLSEFTPDVILLDIIMPRLNGIDFLREVHQKGIGLPPTIVMTNSMVSTQARQDAKDLGAKAYNVKTHVKPADIVAMIKQYEQSKK